MLDVYVRTGVEGVGEINMASGLNRPYLVPLSKLGGLLSLDVLILF